MDVVYSTSHTGSRDYNIRECESQLPGFYFTLVLLPAAGMLSMTYCYIMLDELIVNKS